MPEQLSESIAYLHATGLEKLVSAALLTVINERAADPQRRLWQLLRPPSDALDASKGDADDRNLQLEEECAALVNEKTELEERNATLHATNAAVAARNAELEKRDKELVGSAADLTRQNEELEKRCKQLEADSDKLADQMTSIMAGMSPPVAATNTTVTGTSPPVAAPAVATARPRGVTFEQLAAEQRPRGVTFEQLATSPPERKGGLSRKAAAATPASTPAVQSSPSLPRALADQLATVMRRTFDALDGGRVGTLSRTRVLAFCHSLSQGLEASESADERRAMSTFIGILQRLVDGQARVGRPAWLEYVQASSASCSAGDAETFIGILSTILDNTEAIEGLLETVDEEEEEMAHRDASSGAAAKAVAPPAAPPQPRAPPAPPAPPAKAVAPAAPSRPTVHLTADYQQMWTKLFDVVLNPACDGSGTLSQQAILDFAGALRQGCEASDDPAERDAMFAFVRVLEGIAASARQVPRKAWMAYAPPAGAFTAEEQARVVEILTTILDNEDAVQGLIETMRED